MMIQNREHYYIYGANGLAALCMRRNGVDSLYYVHPDRLGSYTHLTNADKQVVRALHFDPWGNVKADTNWTVFDSTSLAGTLAGTFCFGRGFTGHEHYAELGIINMKAPSKREQKQACLFFVERGECLRCIPIWLLLHPHFTRPYNNIYCQSQEEDVMPLPLFFPKNFMVRR